MKKLILSVIFLLNTIFIFAQKFEVTKEIKFGQPIKYYENWDPVEGGNPGIYQMQSWKNQLILFDTDNHFYFNLENPNQKREYKSLYNILSFSQNDEILVLGEKGSINKIDIYTKSKNITQPDYSIDYSDVKDKFSFSLYYTENKLFSNGNSGLIYWELLPDGKTKFHNATQTKQEMENGLAEHLGISIDDEGLYFGDTSVSFTNPPNYKNYWKEVSIVTEQYQSFGKKFGGCMGVDKRGLAYFNLYKNSANDKRPLKNPNLPIQVYISVLDPWTHQVYMIELPEGNWNPARNENGLIANMVNCVDFNGNIYFTDCNKQKGCYEIKKLSNDWIKQYDFYKREIGIMNTNHIPLQNEAKLSAENNGYNFDHEYLWILEHQDDWCKVRKVDGREGWVETKYINFDNQDSVPQTNVAVSKVMTCSDNLRLRSQEATSSSVISTMKKGTKVKILQLGKAETIDGINSNWVQVEVLSGAKDKDGKEIKSGTIGWCYGGYLE